MDPLRIWIALLRKKASLKKNDKEEYLPKIWETTQIHRRETHERVVQMENEEHKLLESSTQIDPSLMKDQVFQVNLQDEWEKVKEYRCKGAMATYKEGKVSIKEHQKIVRILNER